MKRRSFIRSSALGTPAILHGVQTMGMSQFGMFSKLGDTDKVLVLVQLNGGNDGLNTLIPLDQYSNLTAARADIILNESDALKLEDHVGVHPMMSGFKELYDEGKLNVIQAVGYPDQNRSHFRSKDIWMTGSPANEEYFTGWVGRYLQGDHPMYPEGYPSGENPDPIAISIGNSSSKTCQGDVANFSLALNDPTDSSIIPSGVIDPDSDGVYGDRIQYLLDTYRQTNEYGSIINEAFEKGSDQSGNYADLAENPLSRHLNIVGQLIEGGLETKVYVVNLGGFDTHGDEAEAGDPTSGRHPILLDRVSQAITGFQRHVESIGKTEKVLGMTFSEFGRRIKSNGSYGTDHGSAAPMFLFGGCVKGGIVGDNPEIGASVGDQEGVAMQHDFRSIYGTIMKDWFELEETRIKSILTDEIQFLPLVDSCSTTNNNDVAESEVGLKVFPSPAQDMLYVQFDGFDTEVRLDIFNALGHRIQGLSPQRYASGQHQRIFNISGLPNGPYFMRWQSGSVAKTVRFIKG